MNLFVGITEDIVEEKYYEYMENSTGWLFFFFFFMYNKYKLNIRSFDK